MLDRYYWDACVFLAFINGEEGRVSDVEAHLADAENGHAEIYTSALSIAEVVNGPAWNDQESAFDDEVLANIDKLFDASSPVKITEVSTVVAWEARNLARDARRQGFKLKPADSLHLATARRLPDLTAIHTYEEATSRARWSTLTGLTVVEPTHPRPPLPV